MTDKDIIEMAQKAGLHLATDVNWMPIISLEYAKKFAELIRADEREVCAVLCEKECAQNDGITCAEEIRARGDK